mmetsp:Transcript_22879/g.66073  ORF Transcript_22879/g.66073 Transcript_22879/m.66073 type:complete len:438 (-) Transcript_22879:397-1710(-)
MHDVAPPRLSAQFADAVDELIELEDVVPVRIECFEEAELLLVGHVELCQKLAEARLQAHALEQVGGDHDALGLLEELLDGEHPRLARGVGLDVDDQLQQLRDLLREEPLVAEAMPPHKHRARLRANNHLLHEDGGYHVEEAQAYENHAERIEQAVAPTVVGGHEDEDRCALRCLAAPGNGAAEDGEQALAQGLEMLRAESVLLVRGADRLAEDDGHGVQREEEDDQRPAEDAEAAEQPLDEDRQLLEHLQADQPRHARRAEDAEDAEDGVEAVFRTVADCPDEADLEYGGGDDQELHHVPAGLLGVEEEPPRPDDPQLHEELKQEGAGEHGVDDEPAAPVRFEVATQADAHRVQDHQGAHERTPSDEPAHAVETRVLRRLREGQVGVLVLRPDHPDVLQALHGAPAEVLRDVRQGASRPDELAGADLGGMAVGLAHG